MNAWNSVISVKTDKSWDDMSAVAKWEGVESMWSTTGDWDMCIKLDMKSSTPEKAQEFVHRMRKGHWATDTMTNWWKEVSPR